MASRNDVTGDFIQSKTASDTYRNNWDNIFKKKRPPVVSINPTYAININELISAVVANENRTHTDCESAAFDENMYPQGYIVRVDTDTDDDDGWFTLAVKTLMRNIDVDEMLIFEDH
jgi:hypothetical protein